MRGLLQVEIAKQYEHLFSNSSGSAPSSASSPASNDDGGAAGVIIIPIGAVISILVILVVGMRINREQSGTFADMLKFWKWFRPNTSEQEFRARRRQICEDEKKRLETAPVIIVQPDELVCCAVAETPSTHPRTALKESCLEMVKSHHVPLLFIANVPDTMEFDELKKKVYNAPLSPGEDRTVLLPED